MRDDASASTVDVPSVDLPARAATPETALGARRSGGAGVGPGTRPPDAPGRMRPHMRLLHGMRRPDNWVQLVQFSVVGASGYGLNLLVLAFCVHVAGIEYHVAAALAWIVAGVNNFIWNRHWTFNARDGRVHVQAIRFLLVSLVALGFNEAVLTLLVEVGGLGTVLAQVPALAASTPLNFLGNKLWSFKVDVYSASPRPRED
jgi:putative flippase GtrA